MLRRKGRRLGYTGGPKTRDSASSQRPSEIDETPITQILIIDGKLSVLRVKSGMYRLCMGANVVLDKLDDSIRERMHELDLSLLTDCDFPKAFCRGCEALVVITFPMSMTCITRKCFQGCGLRRADLSSTRITCLGYRAFSWCSDLHEVTFPVTLAFIGSSCFCYSGVRTARLGACCLLIEIGHCIGQHCLNLTTLELPISLRIVGEHIVCDCASIRDFEIPSPGVAGEQYCLGGDMQRVVLRSAERLCLPKMLAVSRIAFGQSGVSGFGVSYACPLSPSDSAYQRGWLGVGVHYFIRRNSSMGPIFPRTIALSGFDVYRAPAPIGPVSERGVLDEVMVSRRGRMGSTWEVRRAVSRLM
jgi:hypothetical protein